MNVLINILVALEWLTFFISLIYFNSLKREGLLYVFILLLTIVFSETVGKLIDIHVIQFIKSNRWFNIMIPVQFLCLFMLFYKRTTHHSWKIIIPAFAGITILLTLWFFLSNEKKSFDTFNYTVEAVFVSACCLHYLFECMNSKHIMNINKDVMMYLALGTILFYLGTLPLHSMRNYLYKNHRSIFYAYNYLFFILNYVMYGLISFGIIWKQKK